VLFSLVTFSLAATLIVLLPGPDTLAVVRNLVRGGRRLAIRAVLGVLSGLVVWVVTAALGLSAVLRASHDAYLGLRLAGAAYLLYLGVTSLRSRGEPGPDRRRLVGSGYTSGLLTDLLNPKVGVFFVTFLPGFVPHGDPVGATSLLFGAIFVALTALYFSVLLAAAGPVLRWMSTAKVRRRLDRGTGVVLVAFGARLIADP
jgi:threonine/homoserine/homoserine lactone efflux protein